MARIKTKGTDLYVSSDGSTVDKLACITGISGLGGARDQIDVTCFASEEKEFEGGMATPGQITVDGIYDSADEVFDKLVVLKDSGEIVDWYVGGSDGTTAPTYEVDVWTPPTDRTGIDFRGYVADVSWSLDQNNVWRYQLVIQRSGPWHLTKSA